MALASERGQVQKHLNVGSVADAIVPLPPFDIQLEFSQTIRVIAQQEEALRFSLHAMDALFASLQNRAFRGEL